MKFIQRLLVLENTIDRIIIEIISYSIYHILHFQQDGAPTQCTSRQEFLDTRDPGQRVIRRSSIEIN